MATLAGRANSGGECALNTCKTVCVARAVSHETGLVWLYRIALWVVPARWLRSSSWRKRRRCQRRSRSSPALELTCHVLPTPKTSHHSPSKLEYRRIRWIQRKDTKPKVVGLRHTCNTARVLISMASWLLSKVRTITACRCRLFSVENLTGNHG